jgi:hypothetical protein
MNSITTTIATLTATLLLGVATSAIAGEGGADKGMHKGHGDRMQPHDCSKAPADRKDRCEARNKIIAACKDKPAGDERRQCVMSNMPKKDAKAEEKK